MVDDVSALCLISRQRVKQWLQSRRLSIKLFKHGKHIILQLPRALAKYMAPKLEQHIRRDLLNRWQTTEADKYCHQ